MTKLVATFDDGTHVNIQADRIEREQGTDIIYAYREEKLVGAFSVMHITKLYIAEQKE